MFNNEIFLMFWSHEQPITFRSAFRFSNLCQINQLNRGKKAKIHKSIVYLTDYHKRLVVFKGYKKQSSVVIDILLYQGIEIRITRTKWEFYQRRT